MAPWLPHCIHLHPSLTKCDIANRIHDHYDNGRQFAINDILCALFGKSVVVFENRLRDCMDFAEIVVYNHPLQGYSKVRLFFLMPSIPCVCFLVARIIKKIHAYVLPVILVIAKICGPLSARVIRFADRAKGGGVFKNVGQVIDIELFNYASTGILHVVIS